MLKLFSIPITKALLTGSLLLLLQLVVNAQVETVINKKGGMVEVRNTIVTTAATVPSAPLQNDIWFDTSVNLTKIYDGASWLVINEDALTTKENAANKSTDTNLADVSNIKFPTELAVKTYVDGQITATADDDITAVSFNGTNLRVDEGSTTFSADISSLSDHDWYLNGGNTHATNINQDIYTLGNVGIGINSAQNKLHIAGDNSVIRVSRSNDTASMIFDRYSGTINNTLKSFQFGLNATSVGDGEFFFADYNENSGGTDFTKIISFTGGNEAIRFDQYGQGSFNSSNATYLLGVENNGDVVEVNTSNLSGHSFYKVGTTEVPSNINDDIFTQGEVGINTMNPDAQLDIESTGVPLRIAPSLSTPTGTTGGQMFIGDDGILYTYDGNRAKWLSVDRNMVGWGNNSALTSYQYLRQFGSALSSNNGWRMIRDATITAISAQTNGSESWTLEIRKNHTGTAIAFLNINSSQGAHNNNLNIDVDEGDFLQAYCNGFAINSPQTLIEIAWRK